MKALIKIFSYLGATIVVICGVAMLFFGWSATGWKALAIPTDSMRPSIPPGSLVIVHHVPAQTIRVGNVITHINPLNPRTTLTHRVVKVYLANGKVPIFITKGDANKSDDPAVSAGQVEGLVVAHIPDGGYILLDAKKPYIILPIIYLAAILIMAEEIKRLSDYLKLTQPYKATGYIRVSKSTSKTSRGALIAGSLAVALLIASTADAPAALALLKSNTVSIANNSITIASTLSCSSSNNTSINVQNNNSQSASSGNSTVNGNGNAATGNTSNNSSSSSTITVNGC